MPRTSIFPRIQRVLAGIHLRFAGVTQEQTKLARDRLRLGIANVGFWVLAACSGLWWLTRAGGDALDLRALCVIGITAFAVQAMFDLIGGAWLMPGTRPALGDFFCGWFRGALCHSLVLVVVGLLSHASFRVSSGFTLAVFFATLGLALGRGIFLRAIGGASMTEMPWDGGNMLAATASDPAFTGGFVGFGRSARSLWPARWMEGFPRAWLAVESRRREWQISSGSHDRTFIVLLGWNLLGTSLGTIAFALAQRAPADALFGHACWMTLWAFGGLLVLPALSRSAVFAADRAAADAGLAPAGWITRFPDVTGEDGNSDAAVQAIFYPIPSAETRLRALEHAPRGPVLGSLARNNLYYSCATLTLLGRAVHCNVGRPALWVFPPAA